ncbi:MAG: heavy metal translocating P-type ATPase metal-binding domain-containing protein, partial [Opitutus sp.]
MSDVLTDSLRSKSRAQPACRHCGAPLIDARMRASGFCCAGCSYVYRLVHEHGLAGYYRIKDDVTTPADAVVFQPRDYSWLEALQQEAEGMEGKAGAGAGRPTPSDGSQSAAGGGGGAGKAAALRTPDLTLDIQGISCAGCVWLIERIFQQQPGARDVFVNAQYGTMRLRWLRGEFHAVEFAKKLQAFGYLVGPAGETDAEPESRGLVKRIGLCAAFAMNVMLFSLPTYFGMESTYEWAGLFGLLNVAFGTLSLLVGGLYFLGRALRALRERALHIDLPIAIGIIGAYAGSLYGWLAGEERFVYFDFVAVFILLMLVGRWAQVAAVEGNRRRLLSQQPRPQRILRADGTRVPPEQIAAGDAIQLASGQTLPVEARLEADAGMFSLASINGEALPRDFRQGQRVPAGAVNVGRRELRMTALQQWRDSLLAQLLAPGEREGERHRFLELIVRGYLIGIFLVAAGAGIGWWLGTGDALRTWAVVTAVLVVSCPCAVALAFPLADEMAAVALRRRGVFVRQADLWAKLSRVRKLVFDKTGTLTLEAPVLQNPE